MDRLQRRKEEKREKADDHIDPGKDYYYHVTAINAAGVSPSATVHLAAKGN